MNTPDEPSDGPVAETAATPATPAAETETETATSAADVGAANAEMRSRAAAVVSEALDAGSVEAALGVLALPPILQPVAQPVRTPRKWMVATFALAAMVVVLAGALLYQSLNGGATGENAPPPLALGDVDATASELAPDPAAEALVAGADTTVVDPGAVPVTDPNGVVADPAALGTEVLGTSITASGPAPAGLTPGVALPTNSTAPRPAAAGGAAPAPAPAAAAAPTTAAAKVGPLDGNWATANGSVAGYRITKTWFTGQADEVVGRTSNLSGAVTITADTVTRASVTVDMGSVDSGESLRDAAFRNDLLQTSAFPTAKFDLTAAIPISGRPAAGAFAVKASGRLTVRNQTRDVVVDLKGQQNGSSIQIVGSIPVALADYGVPSPSVGVATVADRGVVEFSLVLAKR